MHKLSQLNPNVTFYIRTAKKTGFIQKSKKSVLSSKELKEMVQKKTKIPATNQILYYNGAQVKENKTIKIVQKGIVHVIDSRNVGQPRMRLSVKRLQQTSQSDQFEVDSNTSIDEFIKRELEPFYEEPAEKLFFVYSGRELRREKSFSEEHVESETQIVCVHSEKDRKGKIKTQSKAASRSQLHSKETIETKTGMTPKKQSFFQAESVQVKHQQKVQEITDIRSVSMTSIQVVSSEEIPENKSSERIEDFGEHTKTAQILPLKNERKVIKSIEEIKCDQLESDQDSDNEANNMQPIFPKKLPEEYLMEQTRERSHTKSDNHNNSGSSSISEPNFKKKKKASQINVPKKRSEQKSQEDPSPKSTNHYKGSSENPLDNRQTIEKQFLANENQNKFKTRDEIFQNSQNTFSSVIDEPEESKIANLQSANINSGNERDDIFNSYINRQENEVYDSQMNYVQGENARMEIRGFMNFSSASFLEPSQLQNLQSQVNNIHEISFRQNVNPQSIQLETGGNNRHRQSSQQIEGDSLSFSNDQSEMKPREESEDNLFVEYRRGPLSTSRNNIVIREDETSESNLLSETYNNPSTPDIMNSITFNLEPNPDDQITYSRQTAVRIMSEEEIEEPNQIEFQKRDSEIETNIRDSANPSQIYSNASSQVRHKVSDDHINFEQASLIEGLASAIDYQINVNAIESENSVDESLNNGKRNWVDPESDISYDPSVNQEAHEHTIQTVGNHNISQNNPSNMFLDQNSGVFVQFQAYTANLESSLNEESKDLFDYLPKEGKNNLLEENSFAVNCQRSLQSGLSRKNQTFQSLINAQNYETDRNQPIKIVEEESSGQENQLIQGSGLEKEELLQNSIQTEQMEKSAAFHEISQSINQQKFEETSKLMYLIDNPEPYDVTFRKDYKSSYIRPDESPGQSKIESEGRGLLQQLCTQSMNESEHPQLLPGDYIYSTDRVESPEETMDSILEKFAHCF